MNRVRKIAMNLQKFATSIVNRADAEAIIREQIVDAIAQDAPKSSAFMAMAKKLPNMTSKQTRIRVLDFLPTAYWVNGDTGMKQTTRQAWDNVYLTAAELAVIVPIPEAVLDDAEFDIMGEVTPRVIEAIGQRVDSAAIFGENRPAEWQNDIITLARQAGNNVAAPSGSDYYDLTMSENGVFSKVESDGYAVSGVMASTTMKAKLRGLRDDVGHPIFKKDMQGATQYALDGVPMYFPDNGAFDTSVAQMVVGDFSKAVYAIRQDITVKILTEGVIQDPTSKEIVYNLAQQDMIALRVVFRLGWALPNPATRIDEDRVGCPFAYLEPVTPVTTQTVTFTVTDNAETPEAIEGAIIDVNGSRLKTNSSGQAVFNLRAGTYPAKIKKTGYSQVTETVVVASSAVTKSVTLVANA
jgi:HK97 family phage major capsid protein